jgi:methyltransferase family protein
MATTDSHGDTAVSRRLTFINRCAEIGFRLVQPDSQIGQDSRLHLVRPDGSIATLLDSPALALELHNTELGPGAVELRQSLASLIRVPKMSTAAAGAIINAAVTHMAPERLFVNVGVWNGYSLLAGMAGNPDKHCLGIDNFSQFGGPKNAFLRRFLERRSARHKFLDEDYVEVLRAGLDREIGVYFYDGEHSFENQQQGLVLAEPFFAEDCVVIVDDVNWNAPRLGTDAFLQQSARAYSKVLDVPTAGEHPTLWNGFMVLQCGAGEYETSLATATPRFETAPSNPRLAKPADLLLTLLVIGAAESVDAIVAAQSYNRVEVINVAPENGREGVPLEAVAEAFAHSKGDIVALIDADLPPPPYAVAEVIEEIVSGKPTLSFYASSQRGSEQTHTTLS